MCDKMAISAHILKIVVNDQFLTLQMTATVCKHCKKLLPQKESTIEKIL